MNIFKAELFRYRKSFYSRLIYILIIPFTIAVAAFLKYVSGGVNGAFLASMGFSEESVQAIANHMSGISYMASALSAADLLMLIVMLPIIIHITDDYDQGTIRYEQQRSRGRVKCYLARAFAAVVYSISALIEYLLLSGIISFVFFGNDISNGDVTKFFMTLIAQCFSVAAFTLFIYMITTAIRYQVISMAACIILVLVLTPGIELMTDIFELPLDMGYVWIVSMLNMTSNFTIDVSMLIYIIGVSLIYGIISLISGIYSYKKQKI